MLRNFLRSLRRPLLSRTFSVGGIDPTKDYYKELELSSVASAGDIKKAYVKMVKKYHPDQNKGITSITRIRDRRAL